MHSAHRFEVKTVIHRPHCSIARVFCVMNPNKSGLRQRSHRNCQALRRPSMPQSVADSKTTRDGARGLSLALHLLEGWHRRSTHLENCATARYNEGTRDGARGRPLRRLHAPFLLLSLACSLARSPCPCYACPYLTWVISLPALEQMVRHHQHLSHHCH